MILLSVFDLGLGAALVLLLAALSWRMRLRLHGQILVAAGRMVVQLALVGLVLTTVFRQTHPLLLALIALAMLLVASREVMARQRRRFHGWWTFGFGSVSMVVSSFAVVTLALTTVIQPEPWYSPRYAIPLLGMLLGNTLNGLSLALDRLTEGVWQQREVIETRLALGEPWWEAIVDTQRECVRAGLMPIINTMSVAGIVSLPGMMTGQILAGADPLEAVKYQILIIFLIAAAAGIGCLSAVWMGSRRLFDHRHRLRLDRIAPA